MYSTSTPKNEVNLTSHWNVHLEKKKTQISRDQKGLNWCVCIHGQAFFKAKFITVVRLRPRKLRFWVSCLLHGAFHQPSNYLWNQRSSRSPMNCLCRTFFQSQWLQRHKNRHCEVHVFTDSMYSQQILCDIMIPEKRFFLIEEIKNIAGQLISLFKCLIHWIPSHIEKTSLGQPGYR